MLRKLLPVASAVVLAGILPAPRSGPADAKPPSHVPGAEAYQTCSEVVIKQGELGGSFRSPDSNPADRRLVIEFVNATVGVPPGQEPQFLVEAVVNGVSLPYDIPMKKICPQSIRDQYGAITMVRLYSDGNGRNGPSAACARNQVMGQAVCAVTVSGCLIGG